MTVHVRMKEDAAGLRMGEDASLDATTAKALHGAGKLWITGGDPADLAAAGVECDADVGPSIRYAPRHEAAANVERAAPAQEG